MIGATSIGQGNSRVIGSFGIRGSGSSSPDVARLDARAAVEQQRAAALEHRVGLDAVRSPRPCGPTRSVSPSVKRCPGITRRRCTRPPSTTMPFAELRSTISTVAPTSMRACRFETSGSVSTTSLEGSRPIVKCPFGSGNSRPASGPLATIRIAAAGAPGLWPGGVVAAEIHHGGDEPGSHRGVADEQVGVEPRELRRGRRGDRERQHVTGRRGEVPRRIGLDDPARDVLDGRRRVGRDDDVGAPRVGTLEGELESHLLVPIVSASVWSIMTSADRSPKRITSPSRSRPPRRGRAHARCRRGPASCRSSNRGRRR